MKKTLLGISILSALGLNAQTFTQADEPAIGNNMNMYIRDSFVTAYSATTGSGVTWDYSSTTAYGTTKLITVIDATTSANAADFPGTTKAIEIPGFITSFNYSSATAANSKGFVYAAGGTLGTIIVKLDGDDQKVMDYPFALNSVTTDNIAGNAVTGTFGTIAVTGTSVSTFDGIGTLNTAVGISYSNVKRVKNIITATGNVFPLGTVNLVRTQYEYYLAGTALPIFIHSTLEITVGGGAPISSSLVLSKDNVAGISENAFEFGMYPNPTKESMTISGVENGTASIIDMSGKTVITAAINGNTTIATSDLKAGMYVVKVATEAGISTSKLIIE
ncbi:MAG: T9SS type A sorting domain-containing protein [Fluviicola sp.]